MPSNVARELEQLKKDSSAKVAVIKGQDWKKSQWHGWADQVNPSTTIEYKSPLQPAGNKKDRGQSAKKKPHIFSNHWDQDPRDPDYVEEGENSEDDEEERKQKTTRREDSDSEDDEYVPEEKKGGKKVGGKKVGGKKVDTKKHTTRSGGKRV